MTPTLHDIESLTAALAAARTELGERLQSLRDEQEQLKRRRLQGIKNSLSRFKDAHGLLHDAVDRGRGLFDKPRTRIFHGIKVGLQKQRGKLEFENPEQVIALIRKHFPDEQEMLIKKTEQPVRAALQNLPAKDLKRLGVSVSNDTDAVLIKAADGEIDKLIDALLGTEDLAELAP